MTVAIHIHYHTNPGESLQIVADGIPIDLEWRGGGWWGGRVALAEVGSYHYRVVAFGETVAEEPPPRREPPPTGDIELVDRWRPPDPTRLSRRSALFTHSLAALHPASEATASGGVRFRLHEPWIPPGMVPAVVGAAEALGAWDPERAVAMAPAPFPHWEARVDLETPAGEYKYILVDDREAVVQWEAGPNRILPGTSAGPAIVDDDELRGLPPWRGAGVAIPVFALRTAAGLGVGQFTDLIPFADWAADVGLRVIQLLPVNDSVLNHDWDDSYPYNPVSVQALHPLYVDIAAIAGHGTEKAIRRAQAELNDLAEIDYVRVMRAKWSLLRAAYTNLRAALDDDDGFADFVDDQWDWLGPYSVWCWLRDRHGSPDSADWDVYQQFSAAVVDNLAAPDSPHYDELRFYWFVQFHLHHQLNQAAAHVRSRGVALKGDLPIGVAPQSVEVWAYPELFNVGTQSGAPPDAFAVRGQNWGFPTYDWDRMAGDDYSWWQARFRALGAYVDAYRIDHVLGFFRIWEIPPGGYDGLVGHFRPSLPLSAEVVAEAVAPADPEELTRPWSDAEVASIFGEHSGAIVDEFLRPHGDGWALRPEYISQEAVRRGWEGFVPDLAAAERAVLERALLDIAADVLLLPVEEGYFPRISWRDTSHYRGLDEGQQERFDVMAIDFFHHRHLALWEAQGRRTLPAVVGATNLLACGEDLGMVPAVVPVVMNELGLLALEIERMPKRLGEWIADPAAAPYLSVVSPGTHDTSTLREWWEEDPALTARYWRDALGQIGEPPPTATADVVAAVIDRQLASPAMLSIIPMADLMGIHDKVRRTDFHAERINDPADRHNRWQYRLHLSVAELSAAAEFNEAVRAMISAAGR